MHELHGIRKTRALYSSRPWTYDEMLMNRNTAIWVAAIGLSILFLGIDLLLPLGVAGGILHVPVVLLTLWLPGRRSTIAFGLVGTGLAILGYFGSPFEAAMWKIMINRLLAVFGIWVAAFFVMQYKKKQQALHESEAKNQLILDTAADGIITFDQEGIIRSINRAAGQIFGYLPGEVVGDPVQNLFARPGQISALHMKNPNGQPGVNGSEEKADRELIGKRQDGTTFPVRMSLSRVALDHDTLYTIVLRDITTRRRMERKLIGLPEDERQQIGYSLHEGVGQMLNGIKLLTEDLASTLEETNHEGARAAYRIVELLTEADDQVAELIFQLTPVNLAANELSAALETLLETIAESDSVGTEIITTGNHPVRDNTVVTHLYRIAREALTNAVEHGRASRVNVHLHEGTEEIRLLIEDNGVGLSENVDQIKGMGIRVMEYRARIIGAALEFEPVSHGGTRVSCTLSRQQELLESSESSFA
jgi:PAS domain S-box-containing protein